MSINHLKHIINGEKVPGTSGRIFDIYNPASGKIIRQIEGASSKDTKHAIEVSNAAFKE